MYLGEYWESQEQIARLAAKEAHKGQLYGDEDYYEAHVKLVAERVYMDPFATPAQYIAAILHDVIEDSEMDEAALAALGIDPQAIAIVEALSKPKGSEYYPYVMGLLIDFPEAALVKYHDMAQNYSCGGRKKYKEPLRVYALHMGRNRIKSGRLL